jgi:hypothetical protein
MYTLDVILLFYITLASQESAFLYQYELKTQIPFKLHKSQNFLIQFKNAATAIIFANRCNYSHILKGVILSYPRKRLPLEGIEPTTTIKDTHKPVTIELL